MKTIEIIAGAQAGFNHPTEDYANFKPSITLKAILEDGDDPDASALALLTKASKLVEIERSRIEAKIRHDEAIVDAESQVRRWESVVASYERQIAEYPALLADPAVHHLESWDITEKRHALNDAQKNIESARAELATYRQKLAELKA